MLRCIAPACTGNVCGADCAALAARLRRRRCRLVRDGEDPGEDPALEDFVWWTYFAISCGLVLVAGLASGLTLALMSLEKLDLEVRPPS